MVTINDIVNIFASIFCTGLCIIALISPVIIAAIIGTRAKTKDAKQIRKNLASGVYDQWGKSTKSRLRLMIIIQIVLFLSIVIWLVTGFMNTSDIFSPTRLVVFGFIFIVMFILGFAINRTIVKGR